MSAPPKPERLKTALLKLDRDAVIKLLRSKGNLDAVTGFADDVEFLLKVDVTSFSVKTSDAQQHKELEKIRKDADALLNSLQKFRFDERFNIAPHNLQTVNLIVDSLLLSRLQKESATASKENDVAASHINDGIPFNYPTNLIDSLQEMRDAVDHAMKEVYVPRGTSAKGNPEFIRKRVLAMLFVESYHRRFSQYPPLTEVGPAIQVFDKLIWAAGMSSKYHVHYIEDAINDCKGIPKRKRERKPKGLQ